MTVSRTLSTGAGQCKERQKGREDDGGSEKNKCYAGIPHQQGNVGKAIWTCSAPLNKSDDQKFNLGVH
jgi:hypothetical protein